MIYKWLTDALLSRRAYSLSKATTTDSRHPHHGVYKFNLLGKVSLPSPPLPPSPPLTLSPLHAPRRSSTT